MSAVSNLFIILLSHFLTLEYNKFYLYSQLQALFRYIIRPYYAGAIFALFVLAISVIPVSGEGKPLFFSFPGVDKVAHAGIYFIFTILLLKDLFHNIPLEIDKLAMLLMSVLIYSIIIEVIQQGLTDYRSGELLDVVANLLGILFGTGLILLFRKIKY